MKQEFEISQLKLKNAVMANQYALECQPYEYIFFRIPESVYTGLAAVEMDVVAESRTALMVLNEYLGNKPIQVQDSQRLRFDISQCESGENVLAYKGQVEIQRVYFVVTEEWEKREDCGKETTRKECMEKETEHAIDKAGTYLLNSRISYPKNSQFYGSCYAIYDYTNKCYRMPCWLWSDAPVANACLEMERIEENERKKEAYGKMAIDIGEVLLNSQVMDQEDQVYGALLSRYRYYGKTNRSFHRLLGPNDTSYSVKWALLPLYEKTGDRRYLEASQRALDWVEKIIYEMDFVSSHYYYEDNIWEDRAFVDTAFCVEGFEQYQKTAGDRDYRKTIDYLMRRFLKQFQLDTGYYGQNYFPGKGVDNRLFTRGHAWVLEGLLSCCRSIGGEFYKKEAEMLCRKLVETQRKDGSWSYLLGYGIPDEKIMEDSGTCEKATAILAYLFLEYHRLYKDEQICASALKALEWCRRAMANREGDGEGGIVAESLSSGITGLPFLKVATGYANAYFILAELYADRFCLMSL